MWLGVVVGLGDVIWCQGVVVLGGCMRWWLVGVVVGGDRLWCQGVVT